MVGTLSLGAPVTTELGHDVYVLDINSGSFPDIRSSHSIALSDGGGEVMQFVNFGSSSSPTIGAAAGLTSTTIGSAGTGESLETTDGGATYSVQSNQNPGTVPCYTPGTMIDTPDGPRAVETLRPGDLVLTVDRGPQPIRWVRSGDHPLEEAEVDGKPVLIQAGALGEGRPTQDLIVSPQHRILVGGGGQLTQYFETEAFAPAKALTGVPGIRHMKGKTNITYFHFACDRHEVVTANGCQSESLLLGPEVLKGLTPAVRRVLKLTFKLCATGDALNGLAAGACLAVGEVRRQLAAQAPSKNSTVAKEIRKWDVDAAMERYEADRLRA